jgi:uncharacterized phiE125 gp8 family phage protein
VIDLGDIYSIGFEVRDDTDTLTTPATHECTVTRPDGTPQVVALTVTAPGVLRLDYPTEQPGRHEYTVVTTTPTSRHTGTFDVDPGPTGIVSLSDAKTHLNITRSTNDEELRLFIDAASEWVESRVGPVVRRTVTEVVNTTGELLMLRHAPVLSVTSIAGAYGYTATYDVAATYLDAEAGMIRLPTRQAWSTYPLTVTYVAGRQVVPASIRAATLMIVKTLWETQRGATALPVPGSEELAELPGMGLAVWRAEKMLEPYLLAPVVA